MPGIFARIAAGEIPSFRIAENDDYFAFLDINPLTEGHTLVIPKKETDYLFDLDNESYVGLTSFAKDVAIALKAVTKCKRVCVVVLGFEVPHAHIHLIPSNNEKDANFSNPKLKIDQERMLEIASAVSKVFHQK
jgi:histidine triad (HIT) family protein